MKTETCRTSGEESIFGAAMELPTAEERERYLQQACGGDAELRQRVEALLRFAGQTKDFLEQPALGARLSPTAAVSMASGHVANEDTRTPSEKPGDRISHYLLLKQIGEGGCGVVYLAEQEQPIRRRVALKVIKLGMDTEEVIARFEAERQALALMDHPNIAKVFDAGATAAGRPYFVMELVDGIKITDYCDQNNLPPRARLDLFVKVCQAIQHAHQKGIIHRDIKPSNILVKVRDGEPAPKVIDFGIAKATGQQPLTDKALFTACRQFIGTPAYMSPEQAEMTGLDIDTRSDIYSLGVLLYELLTGQTPFGEKELLAAGLDAMRRTIREKEPLRPSTRLGTMQAAEQTAAASRRQTDPARLIHLLRGDLDWIAMKCLEKDRRRRYETANGLARDIQRHLTSEPVVARPPSRRYLFQKMAVRNKGTFAAVGAVTAALLLGLGLSTFLHPDQAKVRRATSREAEPARFSSPRGVAVDAHGNIYVADQDIHLIRKVTPAGVVTTLAGLACNAGSADGAGSAARFKDPEGIAVDRAGNLYVGDENNHTIRKVTPAGLVTTLAGLAGHPGSADGIGSTARFHYPQGVAVDIAGNVYVADNANCTIRKVTPAGVVTTLAGLAAVSGSADGTGSTARFDKPWAVAVDGAGNVYVGDTSNSSVRKVTPGGVVTTLCGDPNVNGYADGVGSAAWFYHTCAVAVDRATNVYVADRMNCVIRKVTPQGVVTTVAGKAGVIGSADGRGAAARFHYPEGLAVDSAGNLVVADTFNYTMRKIAPNFTVSTLAGRAGYPWPR